MNVVKWFKASPTILSHIGDEEVRESEPVIRRSGPTTEPIEFQQQKNFRGHAAQEVIGYNSILYVAKLFLTYSFLCLFSWVVL